MRGPNRVLRALTVVSGRTLARRLLPAAPLCAVTSTVGVVSASFGESEDETGFTWSQVAGSDRSKEVMAGDLSRSAPTTTMVELDRG